MADFIIDKSVDITNAVCPSTFVKAKEAMDELEAGKILSIRMNDGDVRDFPRSLKWSAGSFLDSSEILVQAALLSVLHCLSASLGVL